MGLVKDDGTLVEQLYYNSTGLCKSWDPSGGGNWNTHPDNAAYNLGRSEYIPFGYLGMYRDRFTGKYHTHFREYDPLHARWLSEDPAGYADGLNLYNAYMGVNGIDPLGLWDPSSPYSMLMHNSAGRANRQYDPLKQTKDFCSNEVVAAEAKALVRGSVSAPRQILGAVCDNYCGTNYSSLDDSIREKYFSRIMMCYEGCGNLDEAIGAATCPSMVVSDALSLTESTYLIDHVTGNESYDLTDGHKLTSAESLGGGFMASMDFIGKVLGGYAVGKNVYSGLTGPRSSDLIPNNAKSYEVLGRENISGTKRSTHRVTANKNLSQRLQNDPDYYNYLTDKLGEDPLKHMQSGKSNLLNPPGTEWHHSKNTPSEMELLRKSVHRDPALQDILHTDGTGGYADFYGGM